MSGLNSDNFVAVVNRFASLLEFSVQTYNDDRLIDFGTPSDGLAMRHESGARATVK